MKPIESKLYVYQVRITEISEVTSPVPLTDHDLLSEGLGVWQHLDIESELELVSAPKSANP